ANAAVVAGRDNASVADEHTAICMRAQRVRCREGVGGGGEDRGPQQVAGAHGSAAPATRTRWMAVNTCSGVAGQPSATAPASPKAPTASRRASRTEIASM